MRLTDTAVDDVGEGLPIVFAHGTEMTRAMFTPQLAYLAERGFRAIAYDSRGRTDRWEGPYDLYDLAQDCLDLLNELEIQRCVLFGMSMGAYVAMRFALRWADRLVGLGLIGGARARPYSAEEMATRRSFYDPLLETTRLSEEWLEEAARVAFSPDTRTMNPELVNDWTERWAAYDPKAVYWESRAWIEQDDVGPQLGQLQLPTLIVQGGDDAPLPLSEPLWVFSQLPDVMMARVPRAGHTVNLEASEGVNRVIGDFCASLSDRLATATDGG
jgi:pimeloyl-ACP methyl ester carboxylesterase